LNGWLVPETTPFKPPHDGNRKARGAARPTAKSGSDTPLLCTLGWHRAGLMARWNAGTCFSVCERCGCDLVRTLLETWHVPRGCRVVWATAADRRVAIIPAVGTAVIAEKVESPVQAKRPGTDATPPAPAIEPVISIASTADAALEPEARPDTAEIVMSRDEPGDAMADPETGAEIDVQAADQQAFGDVFGDEDDAGFVGIADDVAESVAATSSQFLVSKEPRTAIPDFMDDPQEDDAAWPLSQNIARARFEDVVDLRAAETPSSGEWTGQLRRTGN